MSGQMLNSGCLTIRISIKETNLIKHTIWKSHNVSQKTQVQQYNKTTMQWHTIYYESIQFLQKKATWLYFHSLYYPNLANTEVYLKLKSAERRKIKENLQTICTLKKNFYLNPLKWKCHYLGYFNNFKSGYYIAI